MSSRHPCISFVTTAVALIAVGTIGTAGTLPSASTTANENLKEISEAIHELRKEVAVHRSHESAQGITDALISQLLLKSLDTPPLLCKTVIYELAVKAVEGSAKSMTNLEHQVQNAGEIDTHGLEVHHDLEDKLQNRSQALEKALERLPDLEAKLQNQYQVVQEALDKMAQHEDRLQKVETIASHGLELPPNLEDKLQNQFQALEKAAERLADLEAKLENQSQALEKAVELGVYLKDKLNNQSHVLETTVEESAYLKDKLHNQSQVLETAVEEGAYLKDKLQYQSVALGGAEELVTYLNDKLQNQSLAVEATADQVTQFDERLQEVQTIASEIQEASRDTEGKFQAHVKEQEARSKGSCRSPFYKVGDDCLFVDYVHNKTWEDARKFCREFGGDLAIPTDVLKLREFLIMFGEVNTWIGGSDLATDGDWRWLNGSPIDLSVGWRAGEPDDTTSQNCLFYWASEEYYLNDYECDHACHFVCQDAVYPL